MHLRRGRAKYNVSISKHCHFESNWLAEMENSDECKMSAERKPSQHHPWISLYVWNWTAKYNFCSTKFGHSTTNSFHFFSSKKLITFSRCNHSTAWVFLKLAENVKSLFWTGRRQIEFKLSASTSYNFYFIDEMIAYIFYSLHVPYKLTNLFFLL